MSRGRDLEKGGGGQGASGISNQASLVIYQQDSGDGSRVGGPKANIQGMCKGDGIQGRG